MTNGKILKLIDNEIAECEELWDIYDEEGDRESCKRVTSIRVSFEVFKQRVLKEIEGSVD